MRLFLALLLFSSSSFAQVSVTYMQDDSLHTVIGERYKSGYFLTRQTALKQFMWLH